MVDKDEKEHVEQLPGWLDLLNRAARRLEEISDSAAKTFNRVIEEKDIKNIPSILQDGLLEIYRQQFKGKKILILGPTASGKTSLISFLKTGVPRDDHLPTPGAIITDRRILLNSDAVIDIPYDAGGDEMYRSTWNFLVREIDPEAIIYVLDGSKDVANLESEIDTAFNDILLCYKDHIRSLRIFYIFINYCDIWMEDDDKKYDLEEALGLSFKRRLKKYAGLRDQKVTWRFYRTQLSPSGIPWEEVKAALGHFGKDLERLKKNNLSDSNMR